MNIHAHRYPDPPDRGDAGAEVGYHAQAARGAALALEKGRNRLVVTGMAICLAFFGVSLRLVDATCFSGEREEAPVGHTSEADTFTGRGDIVDRNGQLLATSLATASLYADPKLVLDAHEAAAKLAEALPDLDESEVYDKLSSNKRFVWIKRNLTPRQHYAVHVLGLPGLLFEREERRFYPPARLTSHVVGYTGVDNVGLSGLERKFDKRLKASAEPIQTAIDLRLQHILRREVAASVEEFRALGGNGIIMDVRTGEMMAMVSLPDFDPHEAGDAEDVQKFDRNTLGVYEMGSTFKIFNSAMALDSGKIHLHDSFDAINPIHIGRFTISDYHGKHRMLNVAEVFQYSSNLGSVRMALQIGTAGQQAFMSRMGFLKPVPVELPELGWPLVPRPWREVNTMTIAFGHGISVSPLHAVTAAAAVINGGIMHKPTLLKVASSRDVPGERVVNEQTSVDLRKLFRIVVTEGTAKLADVPGYMVGGKTGTADKQRGKHYAANANLVSFIGVFPINDPKYLVMVMIDEPKPAPSSHGFATAGWTAAPAVGRVIRQIGPLLGLQPVDEKRPDIRQAIDLDTPVVKGATLASFSPDDDH